LATFSHPSDGRRQILGKPLRAEEQEIGIAMTKHKHIGYDPPYYDNDERETIEALKRGEFVSIHLLAESKKLWQEVARNHNAKKNNSTP
jgi:hypothetical protein